MLSKSQKKHNSLKYLNMNDYIFINKDIEILEEENVPKRC
jgi:hypothetical protein